MEGPSGVSDQGQGQGQNQGLGRGVPPYTGGFSVGSSSQLNPTSSQRTTSSVDFRQIPARLGISREDLESSAIPPQVAALKRLGMEGPSGVSDQGQGQGQNQGLGRETGKQSLSEVEPRHAGPVDRTQCDQCGKSFRTPIGLYDHSFFHKGETICTREPCGRIVFKNRSK
ncbi:uncharacterized protein [Bemisia tabaci]